MGELFVGTTAGGVVTETVTEAAEEHPLEVPVTVYPVVALPSTTIEVVVSPVFQTYDAAPPAVSVALLPVHTVVEGLLVIVTVGIGLTVTEVVPTEPEHPAPVTANTEYVPVPAVVMPAIVGFCNEEVNPFGPFHE